MKYMGSKKSMLSNGLGEALDRSIGECNRVFDLFTGSGAVAWHVAQHYEREVIASDLQAYAVALAASVIERTEILNSRRWVDSWFQRAEDRQSGDFPSLARLFQNQLKDGGITEKASRAKELCSSTDFPITRAYGGYYFSPIQAVWLDTLRKSLPNNRVHRKIGLAALIIAASQSAASPGHTAQPFKPNETAGRYLMEAWMRDIQFLVRRAVDTLSKKRAMIQGKACVSDANELAKQVSEGDLVFLDPPYSGVHYSRFYHVLETVAVGKVGEISGNGRYPPSSERPRSEYSLRTRSKTVFDDLLRVLSEKGASAIVTFPADAASNGMSGEDVSVLSGQYFDIEEAKVSSRFSTLGGDKKHRDARQNATELILRLSPR
ncbi:DNA adenine methylase [Tateyamaria omphalii]|uniref:DNA adenine methylase n=1 Tax=Tateyamaria omphalii TaxID=299262 RepID=UPI001C9911D7|nr:DNA adenine methylase [Tateyamaria omphalii]MBY5933725.1 DNA adenine methylase [Tateyamaria omphalii]